MSNIHIERLKQLFELHKSGALTDDEFASKKAEILAMAPIGFVEDDSTEPPTPTPKAHERQEEPSKASMVIGAIVMIGIAVAVVWGIVAIVSGSGDREREPDPISLSASVGIVNQGLSLRVANNDSFHWEHITFYLDGIMNGHRYEHRMIAPGGVIDIRLNDFVTRDGIRYAPQALNRKRSTSAPRCPATAACSSMRQTG